MAAVLLMQAELRVLRQRPLPGRPDRSKERAQFLGKRRVCAVERLLHIAFACASPGQEQNRLGAALLDLSIEETRVASHALRSTVGNTLCSCRPTKSQRACRKTFNASPFSQCACNVAPGAA